MATLYKNTYRNETTRLKNWDYGSQGFYFVTICTKNKQPYFGRIVNEKQNVDPQNVGTQTDGNTGTHDNGNVGTQNFASLRLIQINNQIGDIAYRYWAEIPNIFHSLNWMPL